MRYLKGLAIVLAVVAIIVSLYVWAAFYLDSWHEGISLETKNNADHYEEIMQVTVAGLADGSLESSDVNLSDKEYEEILKHLVKSNADFAVLIKGLSVDNEDDKVIFKVNVSVKSWKKAILLGLKPHYDATQKELLLEVESFKLGRFSLPTFPALYMAEKIGKQQNLFGVDENRMVFKLEDILVEF